MFPVVLTVLLPPSNLEGSVDHYYQCIGPNHEILVFEKVGPTYQSHGTIKSIWQPNGLTLIEFRLGCWITGPQVGKKLPTRVWRWDFAKQRYAETSIDLSILQMELEFRRRR
jgi:hypothetical protein